MGKDKDFSLFIKSGHVLNFFSCVVYFRLKAITKNGKKKTQGKISHSTVSLIPVLTGECSWLASQLFLSSLRTVMSLTAFHRVSDHCTTITEITLLAGSCWGN